MIDSKREIGRSTMFSVVLMFSPHLIFLNKKNKNKYLLHIVPAGHWRLRPLPVDHIGAQPRHILALLDEPLQPSKGCHCSESQIIIFTHFFSHSGVHRVQIPFHLVRPSLPVSLPVKYPKTLGRKDKGENLRSLILASEPFCYPTK